MLRFCLHAVRANASCARCVCVSTGRLQWSTQYAFKRVGRALLYPVYWQKKTRHCRLSEQLSLSLRWWSEVLQKGICETFAWEHKRTETAHLLCDARSTPPRVAAVLLIDGKRFYSDGVPPPAVMESFQFRGDNQITSLEIFAIAFGELRCVCGRFVGGVLLLPSF